MVLAECVLESFSVILFSSRNLKMTSPIGLIEIEMGTSTTVITTNVTTMKTLRLVPGAPTPLGTEPASTTTTTNHDVPHSARETNSDSLHVSPKGSYYLVSVLLYFRSFRPTLCDQRVKARHVNAFLIFHTGISNNVSQ